MDIPTIFPNLYPTSWNLVGQKAIALLRRGAVVVLASLGVDQNLLSLSWPELSPAEQSAGYFHFSHGYTYTSQAMPGRSAFKSANYLRCWNFPNIQLTTK